MTDVEYIDVSKFIDTLLLFDGPSPSLLFVQRKSKKIEQIVEKLETSSGNIILRDLFGFHCSLEEHKAAIELHRQTSELRDQRDREWVEYLKSIGGPENLKPAGIYKPSKDLKAMVRRGIPAAFRASAWPRISQSNLYRLEFPPNHYQLLISRLDLVPAKTIEEIEKDVDRTFPEHPYFASGQPGEKRLRKILRAFALHNPRISYCQSLNFIAGMILLFLEEEEAFWLLATIIEKLLPPDYYTKDMIGTYVDQFVFAHIIKKCLPNIHGTLESHQLQLPLITVQWFMCLFVNTLRSEVTLRIWDMFLNEGNKVLFRIAASLFKLNEKKLLSIKDSGDLFTVLRNIGNDIIDPEILISTAYKSYVNRPVFFKRRIIPRGFGTSSSRESLYNSPRLRPSSVYGNVPPELIGIGFAHMGPMYVKKRTESTATDAGSEKTENRERLMSEEYVDLTAHSNEETQRDEAPIKIDVSSGSSSPVSNSSHSPSLSPSTSPRNNNTSSTTNLSTDSVDDDISFANPEVLLSRASEYRNNTQLFQNQNLVKKTRKNRKFKNGEFNFYRADITLWRASFRPSLEERHEKMEYARQKWRQRQEQMASEAEVKESLNTEDSSIDIEGDFDKEIAEVDESLDDETFSEVLINDNISIASPASIASFTSPSNISPSIGQRLSISNFLKRSSITASSLALNPNELIDDENKEIEDVTYSTYNLDHLVGFEE